MRLLPRLSTNARARLASRLLRVAPTSVTLCPACTLPDAVTRPSASDSSETGLVQRDTGGECENDVVQPRPRDDEIGRGEREGIRKAARKLGNHRRIRERIHHADGATHVRVAVHDVPIDEAAGGC